MNYIIVISIVLAFAAGVVNMYLWRWCWKTKALNLMQEQVFKIDDVSRKTGG